MAELLNNFEAKLNPILVKAAILDTKEILKLSTLINEAADFIIAFDRNLGQILKDEANRLRQYDSYDEKDHESMFETGLDLLNDVAIQFLDEKGSDE